MCRISVGIAFLIFVMVPLSVSAECDRVACDTMAEAALAVFSDGYCAARYDCCSGLTVYVHPGTDYGWVTTTLYLADITDENSYTYSSRIAGGHGKNFRSLCADATDPCCGETGP